MTAFAEETRDGGTLWTAVNTIFPIVKAMSEAASAAGVISHGNGGLKGLEGVGW